MKPKSFVMTVSLIVLFLTVCCPALRLAEYAGWIDLPAFLSGRGFSVQLQKGAAIFFKKISTRVFRVLTKGNIICVSDKAYKRTVSQRL